MEQSSYTNSVVCVCTGKKNEQLLYHTVSQRPWFEWSVYSPWCTEAWKSHYLLFLTVWIHLPPSTIKRSNCCSRAIPLWKEVCGILWHGYCEVFGIVVVTVVIKKMLCQLHCFISNWKSVFIRTWFWALQHQSAVKYILLSWKWFCKMRWSQQLMLTVQSVVTGFSKQQWTLHFIDGDRLDWGYLSFF